MSSSSQELQIQHALQLARTGNLPGAVGILRRVIAEFPHVAAPHFLLAVLLQESGASQPALEEIERAVSLDPGNIAMQELKAVILMALGRVGDAETHARSLLASGIDRPQLWWCVGMSLHRQGRLDESAAALRSALASRPGFSQARQLLMRTLLLQKQNDAALEIASAEGFLDEGAVLQITIDDFLSAGAVDQAIELLRRESGRDVKHYEVSIRIARLLHQLGRSSEALAWSEQARELKPNELEPQEMRAVTLIDRGEVEPGLEMYKRLLARADFGPESANRLLILSHYDQAEDNEKLFGAHVDWVKRYARPFGGRFGTTQSRDPERRLRIGWVSPRFSAGPVASFFKGTLAAFDRQTFQHVLVSFGAAEDRDTADFRGLADEWLEVRDLPDEALLNRLRDANFDIVVDLAGHSFGNRLCVLAQRVAPIQLCWLDYFNTTGVAAIDGWISDQWLTPEDSPQRYVEPLYRLLTGRFSYTPPKEAPPTDYGGGSAPVFVSFNRLAKLNEKVLDAWSAILHRVPASHLELGAGLLIDPIVRTRIVERFAERGIGTERIHLYATRSYADLLAAYRRTDIALDPFPFSGCTTTADALWMGVPVVTMPGTTFVSRQSASLLHRMGRSEWVADDTNDYIERAAAMAERVDDLRAARALLREDARRALCNASEQAAEMAGMFRLLWKNNCDNGPGF